MMQGDACGTPEMAAPCGSCGEMGTVIEGGVVSPSDAGGVIEAPAAAPPVAPPATDAVPEPPKADSET
jgi:hypothetical protein